LFSCLLSYNTLLLLLTLLYKRDGNFRAQAKTEGVGEE